MAKIALLLDEDVRPVLAEILRQRGYSALYVLELERTGKSDEEQLTYAVNNQRAILTHNIRDFILWIANIKKPETSISGSYSPTRFLCGNCFVKPSDFWGRHGAEEIKNRICWLN